MPVLRSIEDSSKFGCSTLLIPDNMHWQVENLDFCRSAIGTASACPSSKYSSITSENYRYWFLACTERWRDRNLLTACDLESPRDFAQGFLGNGTIKHKTPISGTGVTLLEMFYNSAFFRRNNYSWDFHFPKTVKKFTGGNGNMKRCNTMERRYTGVGRTSGQNPSKSRLKGDWRAWGSPTLQQCISINIHAQEDIYLPRVTKIRISQLAERFVHFESNWTGWRGRSQHVEPQQLVT